MQQKKYKELRFTDDFMFTKVMVNNPEICRKVLERILNIKINKVMMPEKQKTIEILSDGKGIRLDVYVDDDKGTVYNIEMQSVMKGHLPKRSRYYQGMIDMNLIERGARYKDLRRSFVIFICLSDPFERNLPVYRFENVCLQDNSLLLKDEAIKVFINADGELSGVSEELSAFLKYLHGSLVEDELVLQIEQEVERARKHEEWEVEYMTLFLRDQENREIGREEGREIGLEEGQARMAKLVNILLQNGKTEEALKVTTDERFREECYAFYNI